ncbi:hypothetical protein GI584_14070 [Gracilibacillus salitolerans]|uniref:Uncharacterized protein n=1 Tax=Gracilibacillus salitolerans TaxID=2663022 RepID=A0A5Q2TLS3_9BACI|nr:CBO0543 family protein [Gracilibacillus salitolerans]QGH35101.1 hypothetical protein GI584_14070 [Gracilibacillus salitolerans]
MMEKYPTYKEIRDVHQQLYDMRLEYWISHDLFSFQWWLLLLVLFIPWIIWWRFVDKKRIEQILLFGTLLTILVMTLDDFGVEKHLWSYPVQLLHVIPRLIPIDQGIIIVVHMFLYQYFPNWQKFIISNIVIAIIFTFVFEPLTVWLGIYKLESWRYIYSLPIYIVKAVLIKWLVDEIILKRKGFRIK